MQPRTHEGINKRLDEEMKNALKLKAKIAMGSNLVETSTLLLRIFTLCFAVASWIVLLTDKIQYLNGFEYVNLTFQYFTTYRYMFATAVIASAYSLLQIPFAFYAVVKGKRMINGEFLPEFDFYIDKLISLLLATGVAAGFSLTYEAKKGQDDPDVERFLNKVYVATGLLFVAFVCMVVQSILSSNNRIAKKGLFG